jgi:hypothetical protein
VEINGKSLKKILKEQREEFEEHVDIKLKEQREEYQRYIGVVSEDFHKQIKIIAEQHGSIIKRLDTHTEMMGELTVKLERLRLEIEKIKKDIEIIKLDIQFIKHELKRKVDRDEFEALEKRVALLEMKK